MRTTRKWYAVCLIGTVAAILLPPSALMAQVQPEATTSNRKIEEIIVYGRQPGPPMWKVSRGEHVLWLFGVLLPLPENMQWESDKVAAVIAQSQEYLSIKMPEQRIPLNPFKLVRAYRLAVSLTMNPGGATLADVVPENMYARFAALQAQYPVRDFEKMRPYFAAEALHGNAVRANHLTNDSDVEKRIERLICQNGAIKKTEIHFGPDYLDYEFLKSEGDRLLDDASSTEELVCFEASLASIETDVEGMKYRADAWARGYVDEIRYYQEYPDQYGACLQVFKSIGDVQALMQQTDAEWMVAAERALANNVSTFAVLPMDQLIKPDGLLEQLRVSGYAIVEP